MNTSNINVDLFDFSITEFLQALITITMSLVIFLLMLPIFVFIYIMILLVDKHNPIYKQTRIGQNGKMFDLYKFRTMRNAELSNEHATQFDKYQKLKEDPRITSLGKLLRKSSIDESLQILNIVRGDMNFIGPRPVMSCQEDHYYNQKPGLTGLTQSRYRNIIPFRSRKHLEKFYAEHKSFSLDVYIILMTLKSVLQANGE